jgi:hypothetical protein
MPGTERPARGGGINELRQQLTEVCPVYRLEGVEKRKGTSIVKDESRLFKSVKKFIKEVI